LPFLHHQFSVRRVRLWTYNLNICLSKCGRYWWRYSNSYQHHFRQALTPSSLFVVTNVITQQILNGFTLENMRSKDQLMEMGYEQNPSNTHGDTAILVDTIVNKFRNYNYYLTIYLLKLQIGLNRYTGSRNMFQTYRQ
jgi:hypothetical protein